MIIHHPWSTRCSCVCRIDTLRKHSQFLILFSEIFLAWRKLVVWPPLYLWGHLFLWFFFSLSCCLGIVFSLSHYVLSPCIVLVYFTVSTLEFLETSQRTDISADSYSYHRVCVVLSLRSYISTIFEKKEVEKNGTDSSKKEQIISVIQKALLASCTDSWANFNQVTERLAV